MDGQVPRHTDALGFAVWILNARDGAAALQHDGQVALCVDARSDMTDDIRAVDGGVLQGQGAGGAVVLDVVVGGTVRGGQLTASVGPSVVQ